MSNTTSSRFTTTELAFLLASSGAGVLTSVSYLLLPLEAGWSARVTTNLMDAAFAGVSLLLGALALSFIGWRQARSDRQHQAELSAVLADLDNPAAWKA